MNIGNIQDKLSFLHIKPNSKENIEKIKEGASKIDANNLTESYLMHFEFQSFNNSFNDLSHQLGVFAFTTPTPFMPQRISPDELAKTGYRGKSLDTLNNSEAQNLISENGFFGITNTSNRIADFVINAAGDDVEKLKSGLKGVQSGLKEAEKMWGGKLPEISYNTIDKTIQKISEKISNLGDNSLSIQA